MIWLFKALGGLWDLFGLIARELHDLDQRRIGAELQQKEAQDAEIDRVTRSSAAGERLPDEGADPLDRDR